jgi:hypothetical protein
MTLVERENGSISDSVVDGNLVLTVTANGEHTYDADFMDRVLQFVLMELGVDTAWKTASPDNVQPVQAGEEESLIH